MKIIPQSKYNDTAFMINGNIFSFSKGLNLSGKQQEIVTGDQK